jgi:hypothetical protein
MGVRILGEAQQGNIISGQHKQHLIATGHAVAATPEPTQLYGLTILSFLLHKPEVGGWHVSCRQDWPCPQVCLAFLVRDGF